MNKLNNETHVTHVTHVDLTSMQPWDEINTLTNDDSLERQVLPHEKAMLINMKLLSVYRSMTMESKLLQEPRILDLSKFTQIDN